MITDQPSAPQHNRDIGEVWSAKHASELPFATATYWLQVPAIRARYNYKATGVPNVAWYDYWMRRCFSGKMPVERTLSIGCGQGSLELDLAQLRTFRHCDAYDIAPGAIEAAKLHAAARGVTSVNFMVSDANTIQLPRQTYDCIWFDMSLHHIEALEHLCQQVARALKPDGVVILNEYVGANRFDFPARQKEIMRAAFLLLPQQARRFLGNAADAPLYLDDMYFPDPQAVAEADPSEAIRSADILNVLAEHLDIVVQRNLGGTLLQYVLNNIAGNFHNGDAKTQAILNLLFEMEDRLIDVGELSSDFMLIVARRKDQAGQPFPVGDDR
ncbi:MAG: methyltransferase domain-containing protein [Anaerolineae bacterium]|nr:methyltransferase domain-containing protein [Anaerolineae bacterium]